MFTLILPLAITPTTYFYYRIKQKKNVCYQHLLTVMSLGERTYIIPKVLYIVEQLYFVPVSLLFQVVHENHGSRKKKIKSIVISKQNGDLVSYLSIQSKMSKIGNMSNVFVEGSHTRKSDIITQKKRIERYALLEKHLKIFQEIHNNENSSEDPVLTKLDKKANNRRKCRKFVCETRNIQ